MSVKFIHTADIHLGSRLHTTGEASSELENKFNNAVMASFKKICDAALDHMVDFIVISGDLYDSDERSINSVKFFNEQATRLEEKNISIYLIAGNHDPYKQKHGIFTMPENVEIFGAEGVENKFVKDKNGQLKARIMGQSYRGRSDSRKMYSFFTPPDRSVVNIALLHTQLEPDNTDYVPCSLEDIKAKDEIDYWALGHIHKRQILNQFEPTVIYPGIPQGRDFGETGPGGAYLVEIENGSYPELSFIPTSSLIWQEIDIEIAEDDQVDNLDEIVHFLKNKAEEIFPNKIEVENAQLEVDGFVVRWNIELYGGFAADLKEKRDEAEDYIVSQMREYLQYQKPFIWSEECKLEFAEKIPERKKLRELSSIFEDIFTITDSISKDEKIYRELKKELGDIWQGSENREDADEFRFNLKENLPELTQRAEKEILRRFWQERGD